MRCIKRVALCLKVHILFGIKIRKILTSSHKLNLFFPKMLIKQIFGLNFYRVHSILFNVHVYILKSFDAVLTYLHATNDEFV